VSIDAPISMAVVGVGYFGRFHAEKISQLPSAKLIAVADIDAKRASEMGSLFGVDAVTDYRDLLGKVDAVSVVVPTSEHYQVVSAFLEHGADVLVEKPMTSSLDSAQRLAEIARNTERILQVGHLERFSGMVETLQKRIRRPLYIDSVRISPFKLRGTDVNVILDLMIHDLDLILCLVDAPILSVDAVGSSVFSGSEDIASARIKFANGCVANIVASRISLKTERRMRIFERDQYVAVDFDRRTIRTVCTAPESLSVGIPEIETEEEDYQDGDLLKREIDAFLRSVASRQEPVVNGEEGVEAVRAAILVNNSLRSHADFVNEIDAGLCGPKERSQPLHSVGMHSMAGADSDAGEILVPLVDLKTQYLSLRPRIDARVHKVLSEGRYILGPEVEELEKALARFSGVRHAICVASGTDALKIALMTEGIGPGAAVFLPSFTFVATAEVVAGLGATPVFVDIDQETFNIDPDDLCRCVEEVRRDERFRACAVIAVDLFGLPADYATINEIAARYGLFLLADAAQSFGGSVRSRRVGSLASVTATSFYPSKPLGCYGDGGCILTNDDSRAQVIRSIHRHGFGADDYSAIHVGVNSRLDTLQAAILLAKLEVFEDELKARERVAHYYGSELGSVVTLPSCPTGFSSAWTAYAILVKDRSGVREALAQAGVATAVYYEAPLHLHPAYAIYGNGPGSLPVCERVSQQIVSLPMHPYLDEATVGRICQIVTRALS